MGFKIKPYNRCVANKVINGHQCTIVWYVDDVKVSHKDKKVVHGFICDIEGHFGEMKVNDSSSFDYLGMNITVNKKESKLMIEMKNQIKEAIEAFGEHFTETVTSPTAKHLFQVDDNCPLLDEKQAEVFHSVTAKLLYLEKRARPDMETAISFLIT